ncbi:MAG: hypothetical protein AAF828_07205, partial [Bacteroidota bacterium]
MSTQVLPFSFDAKGIVVLSDADMVASAYIDGALRTEVGVHDALTVIEWGKTVPAIRAHTLEVPNSVTNWVDGLDISIDGKVAFVVDTKGSLPRSIQQVSNVQTDLPLGNTLYAIDVADPANPKLLDRIGFGKELISVDVNPVSGALLVVNREAGKEVAFVSWEDGRFGEVKLHAVTHRDRVVTHGSWHPNGQYFGLSMEPQAEIAFYAYGEQRIEAVGGPLKAGSYPGAGKFSNNGKYYLVPDLKW